MKKSVKYYSIIGLLFLSNNVLAEPVCTSDAEIIENMNVVRQAFEKTSNLRITQMIESFSSDDEPMFKKSDYTYDFVDLDFTDFILITDVKHNVKPPVHGLVKNIYFGVDIANQEIDLFIFHSLLGMDERLLASFKLYGSDDKCVFKTEVYENSYYALLTIDSLNSIRIEYYFNDTGLVNEFAPLYLFK